MAFCNTPSMMPQCHICISIRGQELFNISDGMLYWKDTISAFDYFIWMFQPLVIVLFKKNQDMFTCFSKVDDMAKITRFQASIRCETEASSLAKDVERETISQYIKDRKNLIDQHLVPNIITTNMSSCNRSTDMLPSTSDVQY